MQNINPAHATAVMNLINRAPYFQLLSIQVVKLNAGYSRVEVDLEEKHLNPFGGLHGGVYSSVIDTAAYWAVYFSVEENSGYISIDVSVDNFAAVKKGLLIVEGFLIKSGRNICVAEAMVTDIQGKKLAYGKSKVLVTPGKQTISQALSLTESISLPRKYNASNNN